MPTRSMGTILFSLSHSSRYCPLVLAHAYRSSRSSVGMPFVTLCVMDLRHAAYSGEDAERPERHAHAEHGHDGVFRCLIAARWCSCRHLSFLTLQRGNALRDALRHGFMPSRLFRRERRASRTACPRGAWARWCFPMPHCCPQVFLQASIVPHAPALAYSRCSGLTGSPDLAWSLSRMSANIRS
ncbi:DUF1534 domain-containing protein [Pseudomonas congelans]|nr:DUF1534 domain-containing protein [Pseudomonas congelans]